MIVNLYSIGHLNACIFRQLLVYHAASGEVIGRYADVEVSLLLIKESYLW